MKEIHIATDFSRAPAGRYCGDGPRSGEEFREKYLVPALRSGERVVVYLDGVEGYGSSFLEEAFGGLVRVNGFQSDNLLEILMIETKDIAWKKEVIEYIKPSLKTN